ncbi:MAG: GMC family oxidoreductase [Gammaproteobacteria bacterium]|nr:GMC family oxidoreductase [Gammaproteobacteria bacterium]MDH4253331.1 GMC family oxidoreductase [Gammaproteobacteria bacterium]MDH5309940.1 GMC family oxidoreductase [Gammaproteobacteria bacterium]
MAKVFDRNDSSVVVVIGSGAGGGTVSRELAASGVDVVCLEAGGPTAEVVTNASAMFPRLTWLDRRIGSGDLPAGFPIWSGKGVGGTTQHWTAHAPRYPDYQLAPSRYFGGLPGVSVIDWPVPQEEMAHYYALAEKSMGVSGTNGWPKLPESNNYRVLAEGARRIGLTHVERSNMAINSVAQGGRPACLQLGFCVSGCAVNAKWTSANTPIAQALRTNHFELRDRSFVLRVEHDERGRASEVVYVDAGGNLQRQKARAVCMAANSIDTPRILLNSDSAAFPGGLGNRSGHIGRHYTKHVFAIVTAIMPKPVHMERGTDNLGAVLDFIPNDPTRGYAGGFVFEQVSFDPANLSSLSRPGAWGAEYAEQLRRYDHYTGLLVMGEDPAQESNGVTLHPSEKDQYGMPVPVVHYADHDNSKRMRSFGIDRARELYEALGSTEIYVGPPPPATHNMGTCRMARDANDGACDPWGRSFDVPNLFFSDGSPLPSSGTSNPTLTIVALATRQAEHIRQLMASKAL